MSPRTVTDPLLREAPILRVTDTVAEATRSLLDAALPALPVVDERERLFGICATSRTPWRNDSSAVSIPSGRT